MQINPNIFKTYDIRGIYGADFNEETAYLLGRAYVDFLQSGNTKSAGWRKKPTIAIARDMRQSSEILKKSLIKGLIEQGANVVDINLASTPTFYFAVGNYNYDGGIVITASHNPKEWNGFKIVKEKAIPVSANTGINILKEKIINNKIKNSEERGNIVELKNVLKAQIEHDLKFADIKKIKPLKIAVDTANGMGAEYIEELFKHLPCELIKINFELNGNFPAHEADPIKEKNLLDIKTKILEEKAELGIAIDGDGDRIFFIDENGNTINQSIIRGVLAMIFLHEKPGSKICYDIRPGRITRDLIEERGGIPIITKVGHSLIKEQMIKENSYFAGESSGHFFLNMDIGCFEAPVIMILKLLQEFSESDKKISAYIKPYQKYFHSGEINSSVSLEYEQIFKKIISAFPYGKINRLDGITIEYPDFWFNVRGSNTENKLRLNLEAKTKKLMDDKRDEVLNIIRG